MPIEFTDSAGKHGIPDEDALYVMQNSIYTSTNVKAAPNAAPNPRRVFVGPQHAGTERLVEVLIEVKSPGVFTIYHAMPLGSYYRKQMEEEQQ
ncbi:hypothetical protein F6W69_18915 [Microbacterium oxydans]|uniref:hypothetical protein n=1 Tax=Microbacterium oxydans TaxID=82380 RepID=UPI001141B464|nr:hypothetical protein [Microbacterium oxydans]KAB1888826.1 hypothetical protein F6W69_18915 [Microbacterium oxydans]GED40644.1 hypothetical protein MOX01_37860 [Microbacterium oxydans]